MSDIGDGHKHGGQVDERELREQGVRRAFGEDAEGCRHGEHRDQHDVEQEHEANEVPDDGDVALVGSCPKPAEQGRAEAEEDVEVPAFERHLHWNGTELVPAPQDEFHDYAESLQVDEPGHGRVAQRVRK